MSKAKQQFVIVRDGEEKTFEEEGAWRDMQQLLDENDVDYEAHGPSKSDGGKPKTNGENRQSSMMEQQDKIDEQSEESEDTEEEAQEPEVVDEPDVVESEPEPDVVEEPEVVEAEPTKPTNPEELSKDPIGFLRSVNSDFVNTIKGTPAISKQGFRFIQREFEISTESEVVKWSDDPLGCVVWAKAELPGGYSAEAHGEGYQSERDVSDNEFVRYADTRAKNRAISDLTSAGALAVSELEE
jgi:hypothetical protein